MDNSSRSKLVNLLLAKSIGESLLVGILAIVFFFIAFPPYFHGWGEATANTISGWAVNHAQPNQHVTLQLFIDDAFVAVGTADQSRTDVVAAGRAADEWHGYVFPIPKLAPGRHVARVYAVTSAAGGVRKSLQSVGDPISFEIDANGTAHSLDKRK